MQRVPHDHINVNGDLLVLLWEDPTKLSVSSKQQMQNVFVDAFMKQYRIAGTKDDFSDEELEDDLINYFESRINPRFAENNKHNQLLLCARYVGQVCGFIFWEDLGENQAYVAELAIAPQYWQHGLGKIFMKSIFYRRPRTSKILLLTEHQNLGAQKFYEALGYHKSNYMHVGYGVEEFCAYELDVDFEASLA